MKTAEIDRALSDLASAQWGMVTAAQARARGVSRVSLANREAEGRLDRLAHGVYRVAGSASNPLDDLRAAWLSTNPVDTATARRRAPDVVVGSAGAALVHGIGDLDPLPYLMIATVRRQTKRREIAYSTRPLDRTDITVREGLPVTTVERTLADIVHDYGDLSLASDALRSARDKGLAVDDERLAHLLAPLARRYDLAEGDGHALLGRLLAGAGLDDYSRAVESITTNTALREAITALVGVSAERLTGSLKAVAGLTPRAAP